MSRTGAGRLVGNVQPPLILGSRPLIRSMLANPPQGSSPSRRSSTATTGARRSSATRAAEPADAPAKRGWRDLLRKHLRLQRVGFDFRFVLLDPAEVRKRKAAKQQDNEKNIYSIHGSSPDIHEGGSGRPPRHYSIGMPKPHETGYLC